MSSATERCMNCYTCERGVAPSVTADMFRQAKEAGTIPQEWYTEAAARCGACVECQKCFTRQQGQQRPARKPMVNYFLFLTNDCNLRCTYCYATKKPLIMSSETLERLKVFLTREEHLRLGDHDVNIQFFGGEPTMEWYKLEKFIEEFSELWSRLYGTNVRWGMTTNGTLLNEDRLKFLKRHNLIPLLSIDGRRETHNTHRKNRGGGGSFDDIPLDLILKYFPSPEIRPTITPETVADWCNDLEWFYEQGLFLIATEVAYEADWGPDAMAAARHTFERLGEIYVQRRKAGLPVWMKFIEDGLGCLGRSEQRGHVCGTARGLVAIDSQGLLYSCQRYASFSNPDVALGNIWSGFDEHKLAEAQLLKREDMFPMSGFNCSDCVARWRCRGGCNAMNYQVNGDRRNILFNYCLFTRMWAEITLKVLARTGELWGKKYPRKSTCVDLPDKRTESGEMEK